MINSLNHSNRSSEHSETAEFRSYTGHWRMTGDTTLSLCPTAKSMLNVFRNEISVTELPGILSFAEFLKLKRAYIHGMEHGDGFEVEIQLAGSEGPRFYLITAMVYRYNWSHQGEMFGKISEVTQTSQEEHLGLSIINHELRCPLTVMRLNTQSVIRLIEKDSRKKLAIKLLQQVDHHISGITQILDDYLVKNNNDFGLKVNYQAFDLNKLATTLLTEMAILHIDHQFRKEMATPVSITADKYKIMRVMINYITNAVSYSSPGSLITLRIEQDGNFAKVAVIDEGPGISAGQEQLIFEKFYRTPGTNTNRNNRGLGL